jgi:rod shape-determining protein MreC
MTLTARQLAVLVALFVATSVTLILLDRQQRLETVKAPVNLIAGTLEVTLSRAFDRVLLPGRESPSELAAELAALRAERDRLLAENARLKELEREIAQLREQLAFQQQNPDLRLVPATVIAYDPNAVQQAIIIDRGADDGIQVGLPVVSPDFLVGLVTEVEADRARVALLIDASLQIGAKLQESGAEGILYGQWRQGGLLEVRHLDPSTPVREGELVVTSGRTRRVPPGLVIGRVYAETRAVEASELRVTVRPLVDYRALRTVSVILVGKDQ